MLAGELGIDIGVIQRFTLATAQLDARAFMLLLKQHLGMAALVVGPDFALGRNRSGDIDKLRTLGDELGYTLHVVEPVAWAGKPVRSSVDPPGVTARRRERSGRIAGSLLSFDR